MRCQGKFTNNFKGLNITSAIFYFNWIIAIIIGLNLFNSVIRIQYATWKDWKTYLLAIAVIPELIYNLMITFIFMMSYYDFYIKGKLILKNDNYA